MIPSIILSVEIGYLLLGLLIVIGAVSTWLLNGVKYFAQRGYEAIQKHDVVIAQLTQSQINLKETVDRLLDKERAQHVDNTQRLSDIERSVTALLNRPHEQGRGR